MKKVVISLLAIAIIATGVIVGVKVFGKSNVVSADKTKPQTSAEDTTKDESTTEDTTVPEETSESTTAEPDTTEKGETAMDGNAQAGNSQSGDSSSIHWDAVPGAVKYKVYRSTSKNGKYTLIATTTGTSYVDKTALPGVTYYYKVGYVKAESTTAKAQTKVNTTRPVNTTKKTTTTTTTPTTKWSLFNTTKSTTTTTKANTTKSSGSALASSYGSGQVTGFEQEMLGYMNNYRSKAGVAPLTINNDLQNAARKRAYELSVVYSHNRLGKKAWSTILDELTDPTVTSWTNAAENIAEGQSTAKQVSTEWYGSKTHRDNILNANFKYVGFGCYEKSGKRYWEQLFVG